MIPKAAAEFDTVGSACSTSNTSARSTPQGLGPFFFSAPTSPTKASAFYNDFSRAQRQCDPSLTSSVPFDWEEKPGIPKPKENDVLDDDDDDDDDDGAYVFEFSGQLEMTNLLSADELFDGGIIKPLKPPPRPQVGQLSADSWSPKSPKSPKEMTEGAFSPRPKRKDFDPFAGALEQCSLEEPHGRGRERTTSNFANHLLGSRKKGTRSLSPFGVSDLIVDSPHNDQSNQEKTKVSSFASFWCRKWKLKDLLRFRRASHRRVSSKDEMKRQQEGVKGRSSLGSIDSVGSISSSNTTNRAVSEEKKKTTFLPYKRDLLGCLRFNKAVAFHSISHG